MARQPTAIDWDRAFAFFASLEPTERSFQRVADEFPVSYTSVKKHAKAERWIERAEALDKRAAEQANRQIVKARSERIADVIEIAVEARRVYLEQLKGGEHEVKGSDVAALTRTEALVEGEATERIELAAVIEHERELLDFFVGFVPAKDREKALTEYGRRFGTESNGSSNGG
jgi:hypothetical protein